MTKLNWRAQPLINMYRQKELRHFTRENINFLVDIDYHTVFVYIQSAYILYSACMAQ